MEKLGLQQIVRDTEQHIIVLSGPLLATSGIIAGLDVVTNNFIANKAPNVGAVLGLIWAICLMLTLDFQVLTLGVRARRVYVHPCKGKGTKISEMFLAFVIAAALGYVSLQMGSIFSRMMGTSLSMEQAQAQLGINPIWLIYERAGMVMLLIFMSGWLRDEDPGLQAQESVNTGNNVNTLARSDVETIISALSELQSLRTQITELQQQQQAQMTPAPSQPMLEAPEKHVKGLQEDGQGIHTTVELPPVETLEKPERGLPSVQSYGDQIEALYKDNPQITSVEIAEKLGCSRTTAANWLKRLKPVE